MTSVLDFAYAETAKWQPDEEFTHRMYIQALIQCFLIGQDSSNNNYIVAQIRDHQNKSGHEISKILNAHFKPSTLTWHVARALTMSSQPKPSSSVNARPTLDTLATAVTFATNVIVATTERFGENS
jgi:hypothetical protein